MVCLVDDDGELAIVEWYDESKATWFHKTVMCTSLMDSNPWLRIPIALGSASVGPDYATMHSEPALFSAAAKRPQQPATSYKGQKWVKGRLGHQKAADEQGGAGRQVHRCSYCQR